MGSYADSLRGHSREGAYDPNSPADRRMERLRREASDYIQSGGVELPDFYTPRHRRGGQQAELASPETMQKVFGPMLAGDPHTALAQQIVGYIREHGSNSAVPVIADMIANYSQSPKPDPRLTREITDLRDTLANAQARIDELEKKAR